LGRQAARAQRSGATKIEVSAKLSARHLTASTVLNTRASRANHCIAARLLRAEHETAALHCPLHESVLQRPLANTLPAVAQIRGGRVIAREYPLTRQRPVPIEARMYRP